MPQAAQSPYLNGQNRLADVIAAIQTMGTYKFYKGTFADWADRITGDATQAEHWRTVFKEHPEFFRLDAKRERASLVLRRQRQKLYNVDEDRVWSRKDYIALPPEATARFSRSPLAAAELEALIDVAINLHAREAERERDKRWFVSPLLAFFGAALGTLLPLIFGR